MPGIPVPGSETSLTFSYRLHNAIVIDNIVVLQLRCEAWSINWVFTPLMVSFSIIYRQLNLKSQLWGWKFQSLLCANVVSQAINALAKSICIYASVENLHYHSEEFWAHLTCFLGPWSIKLACISNVNITLFWTFKRVFSTYSFISKSKSSLLTFGPNKPFCNSIDLNIQYLFW